MRQCVKCEGFHQPPCPAGELVLCGRCFYCHPANAVCIATGRALLPQMSERDVKKAKRFFSDLETVKNNKYFNKTVQGKTEQWIKKWLSGEFGYPPVAWEMFTTKQRQVIRLSYSFPARCDEKELEYESRRTIRRCVIMPRGRADAWEAKQKYIACLDEVLS